MPDYQTREIQTDEWKKRFPNCQEEVPRFIAIINNAFLLGRKMRDKIHPDDHIMELYEACLPNPRWFLKCDNMELEHLIQVTEDAFLCTLSHHLDDLESYTFGDLFDEAQRHIAV